MVLRALCWLLSLLAFSVFTHANRLKWGILIHCVRVDFYCAVNADGCGAAENCKSSANVDFRAAEAYSGAGSSINIQYANVYDFIVLVLC